MGLTDAACAVVDEELPDGDVPDPLSVDGGVLWPELGAAGGGWAVVVVVDGLEVVVVTGAGVVGVLTTTGAGVVTVEVAAARTITRGCE